MQYKSIVFGIALFWVVGTSAFYDMGSGNGPVVPNPAPSPTPTVGEELLGATEFWKLTSGNLNPVVGSWGLAVPGLSGVGPGTECVQVSATGVFSATGAACGTGSGGSSFSGLDFGVIGGTDVKISSIQFDAGGFNVSNTASQGFVRIDYTNGPASRAMDNAWTAVGSTSFAGSVSVAKGFTASSFQGGGLIDCTGNNALRYTSGQFSCSAVATGTVTSVAMTVPTGLSISGSPITTSGTLALTLTAGYEIPLTASTTGWEAFYDAPSSRITAGTNLSWVGNTLNATAGGGSSFTGLDFGTIGGSQVKISSLSFDAGMFDLSNTASEGFVRLDWTNGPASRSTANTWTALNTFSASASVSGSLELAGTASISGAVVIGSGLTGTAKGLVVNNGSSTGNIFEAQDNGTAVFTVANGGTTTITIPDAANVGQIIKGFTSQSANLQQIQDSSANVVASFGVPGEFGGSSLIVRGATRGPSNSSSLGGIFIKDSITTGWYQTFGFLDASNNVKASITNVSSVNGAMVHSVGTTQTMLLTALGAVKIGGITNYTDVAGAQLQVTSPAGGSAKALIANNSTSTGNIFEAQDNGTAVFTVANGGAAISTIGYVAPVNAVGYGFGSGYEAYGLVVNTVTGGIELRTSGNSFAGVTTSHGFGVSTDGITFFSSTVNAGTADTRLFREAAAILQMGLDVNGSAVHQTFKAHDGITGTDIAGANLTIAGGRGTGAGLPGLLQFQTATQLGTGTTAQTLSRIGSASQAGWEFSGFASASSAFGMGLSSCTGSNALQWSGGLFSCAAVSGGGGVASSSLDWDEFKVAMTLDQSHTVASAGFGLNFSTGGLGVKAGGAINTPFEVGGIASISRVLLGNSVSQASVSLGFANDRDTGFGNSNGGVGTIDIVTDNILVAQARSTVLYVNQDITDANTSRGFHIEGSATGAASAPTYSWDGDNNTGMYSASADALSFATGGNLKLNISATTVTFGSGVQLLPQNGTVAAPGLAFNSDSTTGFSLAANNTAVVVSNAAIRIASGSTSGWEFGGTASISSIPAISATSAALCLEAGGLIEKNTGSPTCTVSSLKYKDNVRDLDLGLEELLRLRPVAFTAKGTEKEAIGFIAEEVVKIDPRLVFFEADGVDPRGVNYEMFAPWVVEAIQEQQAQINALAGGQPLGSAGQTLEEQIDSLSVWQLCKLIVIKIFNLHE